MKTSQDESVKPAKEKSSLTKIKGQNLLKNIKTTFLTWSQSVTYHCFPKIFKEKTHLIMKFVWAGVFIGFLGMTSWILANIVIQYYQYSVVSNIQIVDESPNLFPTVTICDSNPFTTQYAENLIEYLAMNLYNITNPTYSEYSAVMDSLFLYAKIYVNNPDFGDENRSKLGFDLSQIIQCKFDYVNCSLEKDFHSFFHFDYGNCFQFNSGLSLSNEAVSLKSTTYSGSKYGLKVILGPLVNHNKYPMLYSKSLKVFIKNQSQPLLSDFDDSLSIRPGDEASITIERTFTSKTSAPYSNCITGNNYNSELFRFIIGSNKTYTRLECTALFFQRHIINSCQCFYTAYTMLYKSPPCLNSSHLSCLTTNMDFFLKYGTSTADYLIECPVECDTIKYETQLSNSEFPSLEFYNLYKTSQEFEIIQSTFNVNLSTHELAKEYMYALNVYYSSTSYTYISDSPQTTLYGLFSSLGGSLGMFLGLSVFSLIEVFEILFEILFVACFKK